MPDKISNVMFDPIVFDNSSEIEVPKERIPNETDCIGMISITGIGHAEEKIHPFTCHHHNISNLSRFKGKPIYQGTIYMSPPLTPFIMDSLDGKGALTPLAISRDMDSSKIYLFDANNDNLKDLVIAKEVTEGEKTHLRG